MIQVLESNPSFSSQLGRALGQSVGSFAGGVGMGAIQAKQAKKLQGEMESFASQLEKNHPGSPTHKSVADIYRSKMPAEQKSELVKALTGMDPFKMQQQDRLQKDLLRKHYNDKIRELNTQKKDSYKAVEREELTQEIKRVQKERDEAFGMHGIEPEQDEEIIEEVEKPKKNKKIKFNPKNPEHQAKYNQIKKMHKGDKELINKELAKEFM